MAMNGVTIWYDGSEPVGNPLAGSKFVWMDSTTGRLKQKNSAGVVSDYLFSSPADANVFGLNIFESSVSGVTTSSQSYADVLTLSLTGLVVGKKYRVAFNCAIQCNNASAFGYVRTTLNGTQIRALQLDFKNANYNSDNNFVHYFTASATTATVKLQHYVSANWAVLTTTAQGESWRVT